MLIKHKLNVLVIDSSSKARLDLTRNLEIIGHTVISEATSAQAGVSAYKKYRPNLVTINISKSATPNLLVIKQIKEFDENAKVIVVSSCRENKTVIKALQAGANGYILKPSSPHKLKEAIRKCSAIA